MLPRLLPKTLDYRQNLVCLRKFVVSILILGQIWQRHWDMASNVKKNLSFMNPCECDFKNILKISIKGHKLLLLILMREL